MIYHKDNNSIILKSGEKLTINEINSGWTCFNQILGHYPKNITVDLSELAAIDTAGIGFIVKIYKITKQYDIELSFTGMSESLKRLFSITGLSPFFSIVTNKSDREADSDTIKTCSC